MEDFFEFNDILREFDGFSKRFMELMQKQMQDFEHAIANGKLKGNWSVKPIRGPGVQGYVAHGQFQTRRAPIKTPKPALNEQREPLTDIFEEKENVKIYIELPGVEKSDIKLDATEEFIEVKAKNFFKRATLPKKNIDIEKTSSKYNNGVLEITIPKIQKKQDDENKRSIKIE